MGRRVRILGRPPHEQETARLGKIVSILLPDDRPRYTVILTDGRLLDLDATGFIVE